MSNETKRDVFDEVRYKFRNFKNEHRHGMYASPDSIDHYLSDALKRYDAALPDDLPVIAEVASEHIKMQKNDKRSLYQSFKSFHTSEILNQYELFDQLENSSEQYARAWVLGVWRVEETGEIVKLEAEK